MFQCELFDISSEVSIAIESKRWLAKYLQLISRMTRKEAELPFEFAFLSAVILFHIRIF